MTTSIKNKTIEFEKLLPDFKRFSGNPKDAKTIREVIEYLYHDGKYLIATDSHRLIRVNTDYIANLPAADPFLYDLKKKEILTGTTLKYPNVNRFIPDHANTTINLNYHEFTQIRKSLNEIVKNNIENEIDKCMIKIEIVRDSIILSNHNIQFVHSCLTADNILTLHVNGSYLKDALMTVNKLNRVNKYNDQSIMIDFTSHLRPFLIKQNDVFDIVILPIRIY